MRELTSMGIGGEDPLELLSSGKKGTCTQLTTKYRELGLSVSENKGEQSDEYKLRTFFRGYEKVIIDFLQYIQNKDLHYQSYSKKVFKHKELFDLHRRKLYNGEMSIEDFLGKIDAYEKESIKRHQLRVFANSMNVLDI